MADEIEELETSIQESAVEGISSATVAGETVQQQSNADRIAWLKYKKARAAVGSTGLGIGLTQLRPGGTG